MAVSVGGHLAIGGGIGVSIGQHVYPYHRHSGATVVVGGGVYGGVYAYGDFAEPPPPPPPPDCCCCEAPPPPPVYYAPPAYPAPVYTPEPVVVVQQPRPRRVGLGARISTTQLSAGSQGPESDGVAALARLRGRRVEVEAELGQDHFRHQERTDTRIGGTAYLHLTGGRLRPYLLVGAALNLIDNYYGREDQKQGILEGGGGLQLRFGDSFAINGDVRWSSRRLLSEREDMTLATPPAEPTYHGDDAMTTLQYVPEKEKGFEGRLSAAFYF